MILLRLCEAVQHLEMINGVFDCELQLFGMKNCNSVIFNLNNFGIERQSQ